MLNVSLSHIIDFLIVRIARLIIWIIISLSHIWSWIILLLVRCCISPEGHFSTWCSQNPSLMLGYLTLVIHVMLLHAPYIQPLVCGMLVLFQYAAYVVLEFGQPLPLELSFVVEFGLRSISFLKLMKSYSILNVGKAYCFYIHQ